MALSGVLGNLFWVVVAGGFVCWLGLLLEVGMGVGVFYERGGLRVGTMVALVVVLIGCVWAGMGGVGRGRWEEGACWRRGRLLREWVLIGVLGLMMVWVFAVDSWVGFYVLYEGSIVPLLVGVCLYGGYFERVGRVLYLLVYLVLFSTPFVVVLLMRVRVGGGVKIGHWELGWLWWLGGVVLAVAMLVKVPMWGVHGWLPKVHVEAPSWGSVVLAGIIIKMGVYGLWRLRSESVASLGGEGMWL